MIQKALWDNQSVDMRQTIGVGLTAACMLAAQGATPIVVQVGGRRFMADIEDTATGRAFLSKLPLELAMDELNGNEKYCYGVALPAAAKYVPSISAGEIKLYGSNCVVLFYGAAGGYSYTDIGKLRTVDGLERAVGSGRATVRFEQVDLKATIKMCEEGPDVGVKSNMPSGTDVKVFGARNLQDEGWTDVTAMSVSGRKSFKFFKLKAE